MPEENKTPRMVSNKQIIVIDDEINICRSIKACLTTEGYQVKSFLEPIAALKSMQTSYYDAALIDIRLGDSCGISLYQQMLHENIDIPVIFISGNGSLTQAAQTLKLGAYDFIEKPFNADKLMVTVNNCIEFYSLRARVKLLEHSKQQGKLLGDHKVMHQLRRDINKLAQTDVTVLISGESGTGKELIAQSIHQQSSRQCHELIAVNCSAIPENLIDSTLFGHVKGAFTGAEQNKKGFFEIANGGSVFLDEIADMSLDAQASLLRVIENKEIQKVGADKATKVDVRLIAASHKNLKNQVRLGLFREDLFYRLNVVPLVSPPLRERSSDIPLLVNYFIEQIVKKNGMKPRTISPSCYNILSQYLWPGNIRELINTLERMLIMGGDKLSKEDIPNEIIGKSADKTIDNNLSLKEYRQQMEREMLIKKLQEFGGNISQVAKSLSVDRSYLHKKISLYGIKRDHSFK